MLNAENDNYTLDVVLRDRDVVATEQSGATKGFRPLDEQTIATVSSPGTDSWWFGPMLVILPGLEFAKSGNGRLVARPQTKMDKSDLR